MATKEQIIAEAETAGQTVLAVLMALDWRVRKDGTMIHADHNKDGVIVAVTIEVEVMWSDTSEEYMIFGIGAFHAIASHKNQFVSPLAVFTFYEFDKLDTVIANLERQARAAIARIIEDMEQEA